MKSLSTTNPMMTVQEIRDALKQNTFNVYMKVDLQSQAVYRVTSARIKDGQMQVKTPCSRAKRGYLWWTVTSLMQLYVQ